MRVFYPKSQIFVDLPEAIPTETIKSSMDNINLQTKIDGNWVDPVYKVVASWDITEEVKPKTNKQLYSELNRFLEIAKKALLEAEKFAERHKLIFTFGGPGAPEITYYPHSDKIRPENSEKLEENYMVTDNLEKDETVEPLEEHKSEIYYSYDYDKPFKGGWWVPSKFC